MKGAPYGFERARVIASPSLSRYAYECLQQLKASRPVSIYPPHHIHERAPPLRAYPSNPAGACSGLSLLPTPILAQLPSPFPPGSFLPPSPPARGTLTSQYQFPSLSATFALAALHPFSAVIVFASSVRRMKGDRSSQEKRTPNGADSIAR